MTQGKLIKTRFHCKKCEHSLQKVPYHNEYVCMGCFTKFQLPYKKARQENLRDYVKKGRIIRQGVIDGNGDVWYR